MAPAIPAFLGNPAPVPRPPRRAELARTAAAIGAGGPGVLAGLAGAAATAAVAETAEIARSGAVAGFGVQDQEQTNWCWAAVTLGLMDKYGGPHSRQCEIVGQVKQVNACANPSAANWTFELSGALRGYGYRNGDSIAGSVEFESIAEEIDGDRPVCVRLAIGSGGDGHVVAIGGYRVVDGVPYVHIHDPDRTADPPDPPIPFQVFRTRYRGGGRRWDRTYYTQPRA